MIVIFALLFLLSLTVVVAATMRANTPDPLMHLPHSETMEPHNPVIDPAPPDDPWRCSQKNVDDLFPGDSFFHQYMRRVRNAIWWCANNDPDGNDPVCAKVNEHCAPLGWSCTPSNLSRLDLPGDLNTDIVQAKWWCGLHGHGSELWEPCGKVNNFC